MPCYALNHARTGKLILQEIFRFLTKGLSYSASFSFFLLSYLNDEYEYCKKARDNAAILSEFYTYGTAYILKSAIRHAPALVTKRHPPSLQQKN